MASDPRPCSEFVAAQAGDKELVIAFAGWTGGFLTGINVFRDQTFDITPFQATELILSKMAKYGEAHPDEVYVSALGKLVAMLMAGRLQTASPLVRVTSGSSAVFIYADVLEDVRAKLLAAGGTPPAEKGSFSPAFAQALAAHQTANGLAVTGLPDLATMNSLYP